MLRQLASNRSAMRNAARHTLRRSWRIVPGAAFLSCIVAAWALPTIALQAPESSLLKAHLDTGRAQQYDTAPKTAVTLLFTSGDAIIDLDTSHESLPNLPPSLKTIRFVRVHDAQHRFTIAGVISGSQLFVFDKLFCGENAIVMSQLIRVTAATPQSPEEAIGLAKLFLSLSYYTLENPARFIASKVGDIPNRDLHLPDETVDDIRDILFAPRATIDGSGYKVELFSTDIALPRVHRWQMHISAAGVQTVRDQVIYPNHQSTANLFSPEKSDLVKANGDKVKFKLTIMADGRTADGARRDIQTWAASNGPGIRRTHYYYESPEKAEALMQKFLHDAVAVIETGSWFDSQGKIGGKRAVVILADPDTKALSAARLVESDPSVLEVSSACLYNLSSIDK